MDRRARDKAFWDRVAPHYDRAVTGVFGRPMPRILELTAAGVAGAGTVLEVAAGTGVVTAAVAPRVRRLVAVDYSERMLAHLRRRVMETGLSNVQCAAADLYALPFAPATFDLVVAGNILHLAPDLPGALAAVCRVLRPGGRLVAPTYCHGETFRSALVSRVLKDILGQPVHHRFTTRSLRSALEQAGLRPGRTETVPGLIPVAYVEAGLGPR